MSSKIILFFCIVSATITATTTTSKNFGPKNRAKRVPRNSSDIGSFPLHSYMKQIYHSRARGNGNGSFTVSVRNQKILATSIRGFEPEKNGTTWKHWIVNMQFRLGNVFRDDIVVEAELVLTSRTSQMSGKINVSVYVGWPVLAPNGSARLESRALPRRANVEFRLNVTRALKAWSLSSEKMYSLQLKVEDVHKNSSTASYALNAWRCFKHGHERGPFLVLYTQSKHPYSRDDIWKLVMLSPFVLSSKPGNAAKARNISEVAPSRELSGTSDGRSAHHPTLTCYQVSFAIKMREFFSNVIVPRNGFLNYCDGYCHFPIQNHLTPTTHAIVWALWWKAYGANSYTPRKPLCVPTKLASIGVILHDPDTGHTVQKEWPDFSAEECGCR